MRQALGPGALGRPRGIGWRGKLEGGSGWGTHVNPGLFHFNVWQNPLQKKKRIQYSVPIFIQECIDYFLPLLTLLFCLRTPLFPPCPLSSQPNSVNLCGYLGYGEHFGNRQLCRSVSLLESPFFSCSSLSPSSLSSSSCNSVNLSGCPSW